MENEEHIEQIKKILKGDVQNIELVSNTSNIVYKANTTQHGTIYVKFYLNKSSHIDNELYLYNIIDHRYLKDVIISSNSPKYAIFKELRGKTLDELTQEQLNKYREKIIESLIYFYETVGKTKTNGYGILDNNMNGTSTNFEEFIVKRQMDTQQILKDYPALNSVFSQIYTKYSDLIIGDNSLVPIDTNAKNVMLTENGDIKFIDPGELISAPKLMGYGDFFAHTYKTVLGDCLIKKLNLSKDDEKRLRIYAIFSSLNILAFLKKLGVDDLEHVIPYGNSYTFFRLIEEHMKELKLHVKNNFIEER